jgi:hypothetical protein
MLYWTDWGAHSIEAANTSGVNRRKLITTGVFWPNGLTIDTFESRMFWVDAKIDRYVGEFTYIYFSRKYFGTSLITRKESRNTPLKW